MAASDGTYRANEWDRYALKRDERLADLEGKLSLNGGREPSVGATRRPSSQSDHRTAA